MNFYKIEKNNGIFRVLRSDNNTLMLELKCKDVFQYEYAILAEKTGSKETKYDLYLPETTYSFQEHSYCVSSAPQLVLSDISDYCYYNGILVFSSKDTWKFMFLKNFQMELFDPKESNLAIRLQKLPSIPRRQSTNGFFKENFTNFIYNRLFVVFSTDDVDFLLCIHAYSGFHYSSGIKVTSLGNAEILSGGKGIYFKAIDETGEYWHEFYTKSGPYGKIEKLAENEYPTGYPSKDFTGYWKKDKDGLVVGITFLENSVARSFSIDFPVSVRKVRFIKQLAETDQKYLERELPKAELWEFYTSHMEKMYLIFSRENQHYTILDPKDLSEN